MRMPFENEQMTPKERMLAFSSGGPIDRVPCTPFVGDHACRLIGHSYSECCHSAELMAEAQVAAFKAYRPDSIGVGPGLFGVAEAMGTRLEYPVDGLPYVSEPVLKDYADLDRLSPADPHRAGKLPLCLETLKLINGQIGDQVVVGASLGGPFNTAAALRGTDNFLRDLRRDPEQVHRLLNLATLSVLNYIDAVSDLGFKPGLAEPTASGTLISAGLFRQFALPYLKKCSDRITERWGTGPMLHICGNTRRIWSDMADTGAAVLSLDNEIDLARAKEEVGNRVCLAGNVRPVETMMKGTREDVHADVKDCLRRAHDNPKGFILCTGCGLPMDTPPENIIAMMEAASIYGKYPIDAGRLI